MSALRDNNITACIHLAAVADINIAENDPENAHHVNVDGTKIVLSCCNECEACASTIMGTIKQ